jgi:gamma-glutamyl phosphate reductase
VQLLEGRAEANALLAHDDLVDLVIPRGSSAFVKHVKASTRIPVLGHAEGVCHVFIDAAADPRRALAIALDAKTDNPSACNAAECILVHRDAAPAILQPLVEALRKAGVEVREGEEAFGREWGDMTVTLAVVDDVEAAIAFVNRHGSKHTDAIVTEDPEAARRFVAGVDSAGVFVNASTRFADGFRYGLGAEVGVSTSKIHARGPVGLEGLTTTKWVLVGEGHVAAPYQGASPRPFRHEPLPPNDPLGPG